MEPRHRPTKPRDAPMEPRRHPMEPRDAPMEPRHRPMEPRDAPKEPRRLVLAGCERVDGHVLFDNLFPLILNSYILRVFSWSPNLAPPVRA